MRNEPDNLALDCMAARASGMSYGKWKALHPLKHKETAKPKQKANIRDDDMKICEYCKKEYEPSRKTQRYCCDQCYKKDRYQKGKVK